MTGHTPFKPKMETAPPDISAYREGNTGIGFVSTFDSGRPGPHVMVNALTHGNEFCGAHALIFLFQQGVRPLRGKLTLSFANVEAFSRFDARQPHASRYVDEDFNRLWSDEVLDGERDSHELARAREFRTLIAQVDHLLDIHSMYLPAPALLLAGMQGKNRELARTMGYPGYLVMDRGHEAGRRMRDYGAFDDPASHKTAMLVECGQHWARSSVEVARAATLHFLRQFDIVDGGFIAEHLPAGPSATQVVIEVSAPVTITSENFRFVEDYRGFEIVEKAGTVIGYDGENEVRTPYDDCVLVMPIAPERARVGQTAVRLGRIVG